MPVLDRDGCQGFGGPWDCRVWGQFYQQINMVTSTGKQRFILDLRFVWQALSNLLTVSSF